MGAQRFERLRPRRESPHRKALRAFGAVLRDAEVREDLARWAEREGARNRGVGQFRLVLPGGNQVYAKRGAMLAELEKALKEMR